LIGVPYWWNLTKESLAATIFKYRSDISDLERYNNISPIPEKIALDKRKIATVKKWAVPSTIQVNK
jgi:hypothetical protein